MELEHHHACCGSLYYQKVVLSIGCLHRGKVSYPQLARYASNDVDGGEMVFSMAM